MPRKVFTAGEVLASADVNSFLMDQSVMTFTDSTARGSAIGTATQGMLTYLADTNAYEYWNGSAYEPLTSGADDSGLIHIETQTFSAVASHSVNDVFSADFDRYRVIIFCTHSTTSYVGLGLRLRAAGSDASGTDYTNVLTFSTNSSGPGRTSNTTSSALVGVAGNFGSFTNFDLARPFLAQRTNFLFQYGAQATSTNEAGSGFTTHGLEVSYDGFTITPSSGTITGTIQVYGYKA